MILKAEIQAFSYLPLKSAYPQKFLFWGLAKLALANFGWSVFVQKRSTQLGIEVPGFLLFSSLSSSFSFFCTAWCA